MNTPQMMRVTAVERISKRYNFYYAVTAVNVGTTGGIVVHQADGTIVPLTSKHTIEVEFYENA